MGADHSESEVVNSSGLKGKVAIVTGASRGIGRAIAIRLAHSGVRLVLTARSEDALRDTAEAIKRERSEVRLVATPDGMPERVVKMALESFAAIDILINNAGTTKSGDFLTLSDEDWAEGYKVKLFGAVRLCRAAWPELKRSGGAVINIAGAGGRTPDSRFTLGGSVNSAVMAFTKALAQLGLSDGVQVNAINPGLVRTDRLKERIKNAAQRWSVSAVEAEQRMQAEQLITRFGQPEEIAELIAYVLSPPGRLFHGALLDADAGYTKGV